MNHKPTKAFVRYDLTKWEFTEWEHLVEVPEVDRWAFTHILEHECTSITCGKIIYKVRGPLTLLTTGKL